MGISDVFAFLRPKRKSPHPPVDRGVLRVAVLRYLDSRHYTLYADWDISKPDSKAKAADWLVDQIVNVLEEVNHGH